MKEKFEIISSEHEQVKLVVCKQHKLEIMVYYVKEIPQSIPDQFVFAFGHINNPQKPGAPGAILVFGIPKYDEIEYNLSFTHVLIMTAMHYYLFEEWRLLFFDSITFSKGYRKAILNEKLHDELMKYYAQVKKRNTALDFYEWRNKYLIN